MEINYNFEKEIDLIQSCVNRMAQNSFTIKGWLITLATVILALLPEKIDIRILCIVVFATTLCFWYLDAYYLRMERLYRWKYEWVIVNREKNGSYLYDLNPWNRAMWLPTKEGKKREVPSVVRIMFTKSLVPLYSIIIIAAVICFIYQTTSVSRSAEVIISTVCECQ